MHRRGTSEEQLKIDVIIFRICYYVGQHLHTLFEPESISASSKEQWPLPPQMRAVYREHVTLLTISLYASLLSLGVSLIVPMNTKNKPNAKERATMVIVLGEAMFRHRACSRRFPLNGLNPSVSRWKCTGGGGRASG